MVASSLRLNDVRWDPDSDTLVWLEGRGKQGVLVVQSGIDAPRDLTGDKMSVRGGVGYGGGEFTVTDGFVYFAGQEGRLYRLALDGGVPRPITPAFGNAASPSVSPDGKWVVYVHTYEGNDGLALVDTGGNAWPRKLAFGMDFIMQPTWHPDGSYLAYVTWDHPNMPWDGTRLKLAKLAYDHAGAPYIESTVTIAGDDSTSVFQPEFSPNGRFLAYISDITGFGHIYLHDLVEDTHIQITDGEAEHAQPAWIQGLRTYTWTTNSRNIHFLRNTAGFFSLHRYSLESGQETQNLALRNYTSLGQIDISDHGVIAMIGSSATVSSRIITFNPRERGVRVRRRAGTETLFSSQLSDVSAIAWTGQDQETVHGLYYAPVSEYFEGRGAPPLIVLVHGGPTSQSTAAYLSEVQFFTTRGYAVLQINHRGSTGYGKAYMMKLRGNWGIYDVEDSVSGAQYLIDQGLADPERVIISGGSAGGFTVLQSLVSKPGFYKAGICRYGISNQFLLAQDTHKFEERYLDLLLGELPEAADVYRDRSPLFSADRIVDPVIIFQGSEDKVVPQNQSDSIVKSLQMRGVPHEYHVFEGEGHGFRKSESIQKYLDCVLSFLAQHVLYV